MKRFAMGLLVVGILCFAGNPRARAQDEVRYYDRAAKQEAKASGSIQSESPSQIVLKQGAGTKTIPAVDIIEVVYKVGDLVNLKYRGARLNENTAYSGASADERKKAVGFALSKYKEMLPDVNDAKVKKHFEFTIARLLAREAEEDSDKARTAMGKLEQFMKDHPESWQISACAKVLAQLQMDQKDFSAALKTYETLAQTPKISKEIRQECDLMTAQVLMADSKFADAEAKLQALSQTVPSDDPQAIRIQVSLAQCMAATNKIEQAVPKLEGIIAKTTDTDLKALAYNSLGDCYRAAKKPEDALWAYLWVDVVYHQNRQEHAKALYWLAKLFKERGDETKSKQCRDRLEKDKQFAGLEFQRLAASEKTEK